MAVVTGSGDASLAECAADELIGYVEAVEHRQLMAFCSTYSLQ